MKNKGSILALGIAPLITLGMTDSLAAQETSPPTEDKFERPDVGALQKQIDDLKAKVDRLENTDAQQNNVGPRQNNSDQENGSKIEWVPGPRISTEDGQFRFELNGRITYDYSNVTFKDGNGVSRPEEKINGTNLRNLRVGFRGRAFGDFNYRIVADFAGNEVDVKVAYVDYRFGNSRIIVGQTRTFNTLDKMTPPPNIAFAERSAFINALKIDRRVGVGVSHGGDSWSVSGGYFFESVGSGNNALDDSNLISGRVHYSPTFENGVGLHFGASTFYRNENGNPYDIRYRARPLVNQGSFRPLSSEEFMISSENFYGGEFVATYKSFAVQAEYGVMRNSLDARETLTSTDPSYNGGYVELSFFPTGGERTINGRNGRFNDVEIAEPVGAGGIGEVRLAARFDVADLIHETFGRKQKSIILAADWYLNDLMKVQGNYAHTAVKNAAKIKTDSANTFNLRLMLNF